MQHDYFLVYLWVDIYHADKEGKKEKYSPSWKQGVSPILVVFACMWFSSVVINSAQAKRTSTGKSRAQVVVCMCPNIKVSKSSKTFKKRKVIAFLPKMIALSPPLTQSTGVGRSRTEEVTQLLKRSPVMDKY